MYYLQREKGPEIIKNFGKVVEYEINDGNQTNTVVIDFKNTYNHGSQFGNVYLKEKYKENFDKPDVKMKMDINTFNDLADKKMCGAFAYITGKIKIEGSIFALKSFENNVVCKYFPEKY